MPAEPASVVAIDPGTIIMGVAVAQGTPEDWRLLTAFADSRGKDESLLDRFRHIQDVSYNLVFHHSPSIFLIEQQVSMQGRARINETAFWLLVLGAVRAFGALGREPAVAQVNPGTLKKWATGDGNADTVRVARAMLDRFGFWPTREIRGGKQRLQEDVSMAFVLAQMGLAWLAGEDILLKDVE